MIWAERTRMLPFPKETPQAVVEKLARRTLEVPAFVRAYWHGERDHLRMELSPQAQWRYAQFYRGELNDDLGDGVVGALLERRAPMLLRLAMLMALTDLQTRIDAQHIDAAMAWIRHATASVRFVFVSAVEEAKLAQVLELSNRVLAFLRERGQATRSQISAECFKGKVPKARLDASLGHLLGATPPKIAVSGSSAPSTRRARQRGCIGLRRPEAHFAHFAALSLERRVTVAPTVVRNKFHANNSG
ncbi:MAG: hypothetical protein LBS70_06255 [Candidatus Accumulibacter sp.]|jgi:putative DNA primase/helicase|nr:hypothetical protein [Accumulibacter sp.]